LLLHCHFAGIVFAYGLAYAGSILMKGDWGHRLRQANIALALVVAAVMALWLTPLLNPQAISVRSQMVRHDANVAVTDLPLSEMVKEWGHPGA